MVGSHLKKYTYFNSNLIFITYKCILNLSQTWKYHSYYCIENSLLPPRDDIFVPFLHSNVSIYTHTLARILHIV